MYELLCDGVQPVMDPGTNEPYTCYGGMGCPARSYCHLQYGKCCSDGMETLSVIIKTILVCAHVASLAQHCIHWIVGIGTVAGYSIAKRNNRKVYILNHVNGG